MDGRGLCKNQWDCLISVIELLNHAPCVLTVFAVCNMKTLYLVMVPIDSIIGTMYVLPEVFITITNATQFGECQ